MVTRLWIPIATVQAVWVLARTPRLPPVSVRSGAYGGTSRDGRTPIRIVGVGDSIIDGIGVDRHDEALTARFAHGVHAMTGRHVDWRLHGRAGLTSQAARLELLPDVPTGDVYLLSVGVNDAVHNVDPRVFAGNLVALAAGLTQRSPQAVLIYCGMPPLAAFPALPWPLSALLGERALRLAQAARGVLRGMHAAACYEFPGATLPDAFARDGFHPGAPACANWAQALVQEYLQLRPGSTGLTAV